MDDGIIDNAVGAAVTNRWSQEYSDSELQFSHGHIARQGRASCALSGDIRIRYVLPTGRINVASHGHQRHILYFILNHL